MKAVINLRICIVLLFVPLVLNATPAQPGGNSFPPVRNIPSGKIEKYLTDKDFIYERNYAPTTNFWEKIESWINRHLFSPLFKGHFFTLWDIIIYAIAITAIVLMIYYFAWSEKTGLFSKRAKAALAGIDITEENIHHVDFEKIINEAIAARQYRIAIRYLYLKSLRDLSLKGLIIWKSDKTNRDYINEMRPSVFGMLFKDITYLFDYAWYGNVEINETIFNRIKNTFEQFSKELYSSN